MIYLEWMDAQAESGWVTPDHVDGIKLCYTAGFLVREDEKEIVVAACKSEDEFNAIIAIPKAWIRVRKTVQLD